MATIEVNNRYEVTDEFLQDVMITACEGGIGYWSQLWPKNEGDKCYDYDRPWQYIQEFDEDNDDDYDLVAVMLGIDPKPGFTGPGHVIDHDVIKRGISTILSGSVSISRDIAKDIRIAADEIDAGYIDTEAADCIVQVGLFGKIVYG